MSLAPSPGRAFSEVVCRLYDDASCLGTRGSPSANPSTSNRIRINPSAVPTERGLGVESIFLGSDADLGITRGLGRVGAAFSPANSEETFFGTPGIETNAELLERKQNTLKYPKQKITLASAFQLLGNSKAGLNRFVVNMGMMARYNSATLGWKPGAGLTGVLGPFTFGYSSYQDETRYETIANDPSSATTLPYIVDSYSLGLFLNSIIIDYSLLTVSTADPMQVILTSMSILAQNWVFTFSRREESSSKQNYNFNSLSLITERRKEESFGSVQYKIGKSFLVGGMYNYYLMREGSITLSYIF